MSRKSWLGIRRGERAEPDEAPEPEEPDTTPVPAMIRWFINRCPYCRSKEIRTVRTEHVQGITVRAHTCRSCKGKFTSGEEPELERPVPR